MTLIIGALIFFSFFGFCFFVLDQTVGETGFKNKRLRERSKQIFDARLPNQVEIEKKANFSDVKLINKLLKERRSSERLKRLLEMTGWRISVGAFILLSLFITVLIYLTLLSQKVVPILSFVLALSFLIFVPALILKSYRKKYLDRFSQHFPKALQLIRSALNAGLGLPTALDRAAKDSPHPVNVEFDAMLKEMKLGRTLIEALNGLQKRVPTQDIKTFVVGVTVQQESGGNLSELVRNLEDTIHAKVLMRKELKVLTAQARLSGWILGLLPPVLMIVIRIINPSYVEYLFEDPLGRKLLFFTIFLQVVGFIAIKRMMIFKITA